MDRISNKNEHSSISMIFTLMLFLLYTICALFVVVIGAKVFQNIRARNDYNFSSNVVLQYIANKVRQNDTYDSVRVEEIDGEDVLELLYRVDGTEYVTKIYSEGGQLRELFTKSDSDIPISDGNPITPCDKMNISMDQDMLYISTDQGTSELMLNIRSGGYYE